jgi:site-specific DNA recombinase
MDPSERGVPFGRRSTPKGDPYSMPIHNPVLLRIIAWAHDIQGRLMQSTDLPLHAIAHQERVTPGYVSRLLRLPLLAPDIVTSIVNGKNPPQLTAKS